MSRRGLKTHRSETGDCVQDYRGRDIDGEIVVAGSDDAEFAA